MAFNRFPSHWIPSDGGATLRLEGGGGSPLVTQYWEGTKHFFLLILYNLKNIEGGGGARAPLRPPLLRGPWFRVPNQKIWLSTEDGLNVIYVSTYLTSYVSAFSFMVPNVQRESNTALGSEAPPI